MRWSILFAALLPIPTAFAAATIIHGGISGASISFVSLSPSTFLVQDAANSTVGTLSTGTAGPNFNGTYALATSGACNGPYNTSFAPSGNLMKVGASPILWGGVYTICVRATDAAFPNSPFFQSIGLVGSWPLNTTVNAEDYDIGGSGVGYNTPVTSGCLNSSSYRTDTVNFKASVAGPAFQLGCSAPGIWYRYTANFSGSGPFTINANLADASAGGSWQVLLDGVSVGTIATPNTGSFDTFQTSPLSAPFTTSLQNHVLEFLVQGGDTAFNGSGDFRSFKVVPVSSQTITSVSVSPNSFAAASGNHGTTVGNFSTATSGGVFAGIYALATSGSCTGTSNGSFATSGNSLKVGSSDITTIGSFVLCVRATDANFANSPFFQPITVTSTAGGLACDIGPSYVGSIPAGATAAGFTHCAANYDFTASAFSNPATWLDCAGASSPMWWLADGACRMTMVSDVGNPQVLDMHFIAGDGPSGGFGNQLYTTPPSHPINQGWTFPMGRYVDIEMRLPAAIAGTGCPGSDFCLYGDIWSWQTANDVVEMDFIEIWVGGWGHGALIDWFPSCSGMTCFFGDGDNGSNIDTTVYHDYGFRNTNNGLGQVSSCGYRDGSFIGCSVGYPSGHADVTLGKAGQEFNRSYLIMNSGSSALTSASSDMYVKRMTVWECVDWFDPANPGSGNDQSSPHQCNGTVLTTAP